MFTMPWLIISPICWYHDYAARVPPPRCAGYTYADYCRRAAAIARHTTSPVAFDDVYAATPPTFFCLSLPPPLCARLSVCERARAARGGALLIPYEHARAQRYAQRKMRGAKQRRAMLRAATRYVRERVIFVDAAADAFTTLRHGCLYAISRAADYYAIEAMLPPDVIFIFFSAAALAAC